MVALAPGRGEGESRCDERLASCGERCSMAQRWTGMRVQRYHHSPERAMPRFYLQLHECGVILDDEAGHDCADLDTAMEHALRSARDVMSAEVQQGRLCLRCRIVILDDQRHRVATVAFRDAIQLSGL